MARTAITGKARSRGGLKRKLAAIGINTRRVLGQREMEQRMLKRTKKRFLQEVDPDGRPWEPLHPSTKKRKGIAGPSAILIDSGHMARDIQIVKGTTAKGAGTTRVPSGAGFSIGTPNTKYSAIHQYGLKGIPARPFLGVSKNDIRSLLRMARNMLLGKKVRP